MPSSDTQDVQQSQPGIPAQSELSNPSTSGSPPPPAVDGLEPEPPRKPPPPRTVEITVVAQDPQIIEAVENTVLTSKVRVPADNLIPGPRSHRFFVVDYDLTTGKAQQPVDLCDGGKVFVDHYDRPIAGDDPALGEARFHAQNVYAVAARTLALFEYFLGRRVSWAFDSHELFLVPKAHVQGNAYYDPSLQAVFFGYLIREGKVVCTCLSHDVIAHEVTHAILDGLRPRYLDAGLPDQAAFHEGFADLVALLSVFEMPDVLRRQLSSRGGTTAEIERRRAQRRLPATAVTQAALEDTIFFAIAEQLGRAELRSRAIRYVKPLKAGDWWRAEWEEPHKRCAIVVSAVMRTLSGMWARRVAPLVHRSPRGDWLDLDRAVEEGATTATYLLGMMIRALDYMPPVDLQFEDVLDAVIVADQVMNPDDPFKYRAALKDGFGHFKIEEPQRIKIFLSDSKNPRPSYTNINFRSLRSDRDEVHRFIWNNAPLLNIDLDHRLFVDRVRTSTRIGPDGLAVEDTMAEYTQQLRVTVGELENVRAKYPGDVPVTLTAPEGMSRDREITLWGGGTLVFDQFAKLRFHMRKGLSWNDRDIVRQQSRLDFLARHNLLDCPNGPPAYSHRSLHSSDEESREQW